LLLALAAIQAVLETLLHFQQSPQPEAEEAALLVWAGARAALVAADRADNLSRAALAIPVGLARQKDMRAALAGPRAAVAQLMTAAVAAVVAPVALGVLPQIKMLLAGVAGQPAPSAEVPRRMPAAAAEAVVLVGRPQMGRLGAEMAAHPAAGLAETLLRIRGLAAAAAALAAAGQTIRVVRVARVL